MNRPTESELKILQILWEKGPSTVRDVHDILSENKDSGYTTTLKIMQIMSEKKLVDRDTSSRTHIYSAAIKEGETKRSLLSTFISTTFGGSTTSLVLEALGNASTSKEDLDEIKKLISSIEKSTDS